MDREAETHGETEGLSEGGGSERKKESGTDKGQGQREREKRQKGTDRWTYRQKDTGWRERSKENKR